MTLPCEITDLFVFTFRRIMMSKICNRLLNVSYNYPRGCYMPERSNIVKFDPDTVCVVPKEHSKQLTTKGIDDIELEINPTIKGLVTYATAFAGTKKRVKLTGQCSAGKGWPWVGVNGDSDPNHMINGIPHLCVLFAILVIPRPRVERYKKYALLSR